MPAPVNDLCANAKTIASLPYTDAALDTTAATQSGDDPTNSAAGEVPFNSVWYVWTAPSTADVVFKTSGSNYDTTLGIYTGACGGPFTEVASNDDDPNASDHTSFLTFTPVSGTTYRIVAGCYAVGGGSLTLTVVVKPPAPNPPTGLTATPITASQIDLSWTAPASGTTPDQYQILRTYGASTTPSTSVALIAAGSTTYTDHNVVAGTRFRYTVEALSLNLPGVPSAPSPVASATTPGTAATVAYTQDFESGSTVAALGFTGGFATNTAGAGQGGSYGVVGTQWTSSNGNVLYGFIAKELGAPSPPSNVWTSTIQAPLGGTQLCVSFWTDLSATPHARDRLFSWGAQVPLLPGQGTSIGSPLLDIALDNHGTLTNTAGMTGILVYEAIDFFISPNLDPGGQPVFASIPNALVLNANNNIRLVIRMSTFDPSASTDPTGSHGGPYPGGAYNRDGQVTIYNNDVLIATVSGMLIGNRSAHSDWHNGPWTDSIDGLDYYQYPHWDSVSFYANGAIDNINVTYPCGALPPLAPPPAVPPQQTTPPDQCCPTPPPYIPPTLAPPPYTVGVVRNYTGPSGGVPVHPDPVPGELLAGKMIDVWVEIDVQA